MEFKRTSLEKLQEALKSGEKILLVDVLPPEYFAEQHIAGAENAPVYEVTFLDYMEKLADDKNQHIVLYNEDAKSLATQDAAAKLMEAGYGNVEIFPGGLIEWKNAGLAIEKGEKISFVLPGNGQHELDTENSLVNWTGRNAKYAHHGKIKVKNGHIIWDDGKIVSGEIVLDMQTIQDEDLADETMRGILESHLKSSDFFNVKNFPEAKFVFADVKEIAGALNGQPNHMARGMLTIKDKTNEIEFPAMIVPMEDGSIYGQAHFDFDRTLWNVRYGSEKFFEKLGIHLVNDIISLELFLVAKA